ncbi:MAG: hypothetical protein E7252_03950 [Lachnospira sp.]|nr:hypothetical protein [Lachnospira sp.]
MEREKTLQIKEYSVLGRLPNPFLFNDGKVVNSTESWEQRKKEIFHDCIEVQYGTLPPKPDFFEVEQLCQGKNHSSYKIHAGTKEQQVSFLIKIIMPKGKNRPMIIDGDMCAGYHMNEEFINTAINLDVGWVLFDRTELAHDIQTEKRQSGALYNVYPEYTFGALGAWAWGYSRCVDALETLKLPQVDISCIAFTGHSRGGKAAMLAGTVDERATIVNPNEACLGGGGCYRIKMTGDYMSLPEWPSETLRDIWTETNFWFGPDLEKYVDNEDKLAFDTHYQKALIAPRILFVSEAAGDIWANPVGSWMTTKAAEEVFKFLHAEKSLFWYFREGTHYHTKQDIEMLVNIIAHIHDGIELNEDFFTLPFEEPDLIFDWVAPMNTTEDIL